MARFPVDHHLAAARVAASRDEGSIFFADPPEASCRWREQHRRLIRLASTYEESLLPAPPPEAP